MDLPLATEHRDKVRDFQCKHRTRLVALLFTDMVGYTDLQQALGDVKALPIIKQHHATVRETLRLFAEGEEINSEGDSFFMVFSTASDATNFALRLQWRLREVLPPLIGRRLLDRIGIHIGEVAVEKSEAA